MVEDVSRVKENRLLEADEETDKSLSDELYSRRKNSNPRKIKREDTDLFKQSANETVQPVNPEEEVSCLLCGHLFDKRDDLRKHILSSHGIDPAEVGYPDMEMDELSIQREQMDESEMAESMLESETVFCCEVCIREFNDRASLWLHMLYSHREEASTACGICLRVCSDNVSLLEHIDSCHPRDSMAPDKRRYSCQICARQHDSRKKLLTHVKIHNLKDADGRLLDPESMVVLNSDYYGPEASIGNEGIMDDEYSFSCEICYKSFPSELKLVKHKRNAHKDSEAMHSLNSSATYKLYFTCEVCGLSHSTRTERWRHVYSCHFDDPSLVCDLEFCGKVFPTKSLRQEHVISHHELQGDTPNTCEICGKLWATRLNYWKHMMGVHSDCLPFICGVCLKVFCTIGDLAAHVKTKHYPLDNSLEFCCDICGRPYSKKSKMSRHRKIHDLSTSEGGLAEGLFDVKEEPEGSNEASLKCDDCPTEEFLDLEELSEHRRSAHNLVPCDLCPKFYGRTSHLWKHVYKIHKTHPDITCSICTKTSASRAHLAKHYAKNHRSQSSNEDNNYVTLQDVVNSSGEAHNCSKCNKVFRKDHLMKQHFKHCKGPKEPGDARGMSPIVNGSFSCEKCSRIFDTQSLLRKHVRSVHIMYSCELCEASKDSKTELFDHITADHANHPELTCDVESCHKMLRNKKDCSKHKRDHKQGYPPPTCDFCGELVTNRIKLRKHLRSNHIEKTKYMCSLCMVSHLSFIELQEHIKENHPSSIGKPTTCQICARKCPTKYKLETHLKIHGNEFFNCLTCYHVFTKEEEFNKHCAIHPPKKQSLSKVSDTVKDDSDEGSENEEATKRKISPDSSHGEAKIMRLTHNCVCCKSSFVTKAELFKHQTEEHINLKCDICSSFQESEDSLVSHKNLCRPREGRIKRKPAALSTALLDKSIERALRYDSDDELNTFTNQSSVNSFDENSSSSKEMWGSLRKSGTRKVYENDNSFSPCEHCDKTWPAKRVLWQHLIRSHKTEAATTCGVCLKYCSSYHKLDMHLVEVHPRNFEEEDSNATCRVCGRYHNAKSKLQLHAAIHEGDEDRAVILHYACTICKEKFQSRGFLAKHKAEEHNIKTEEISGSLEEHKIGNSNDVFVSSDDDTQFEGFPVDDEDSISNLEPLNKLKAESVFQSSEFLDKTPSESPMESTDVACDDILEESCDVNNETESSSDSDSEDEDPAHSSDTSSEKASKCRDNLENVAELIEEENNESYQYSLDADVEDENTHDSNVNKTENISTCSVGDSVTNNKVISTVKPFHPDISGFSQCSRQSVSLEEHSLQIPYSNEANGYITQNIADTEMKNLVT